MSDFIKEQQELLKKHLPAMAAQEMLDFIEKGQRAISDLEKLRADYSSLSTRYTNLDKEHQRFRSAVEDIQGREDKVAERESAVTVRENSMDVKMAQFQVDVMKERLNDSKEFMLMLAKNPRAIEIMSQNETVSKQLMDQYGSIQYLNDSVNKNGVVEKKETKEE